MVTDLEAGIAPLLHALSEPNRRGVVQELSAGPRRAGELAETCGISAAAMSKHLRVLLRAGLIVDERPVDDARVRVFRLRPESMVPLQAWLDQLQAQWDDHLRSFKQLIEGKP